MSSAFLYGAPIQGMYEFGVFVFSTVALSVAFSILFFAFVLSILGPEVAVGEVLVGLRPKTLDHLVRKHRHTIASERPLPQYNTDTAV